MAEGANKLFTKSDVAFHASRKDYWVTINGKVQVLAEDKSSL
jgi:cytochrome b involved in lipid metabolism